MTTIHVIKFEAVRSKKIMFFFTILRQISNLFFSVLELKTIKELLSFSNG